MLDADRTLLRGIERGEAAALEALAQHYAPPVYRYLVRMCGDATLAEDLAQDVALQLWRALPGRRFPNAKALNAWVFTVATNAFRMHARRKQSGEVSLEPDLEIYTGPDCDPAACAEREELAGDVRRAVDSLPEAERRAVLLKTYGDLRYHEIAAATGEPVGTVKWRISRAYVRLRQMLTPETPGEGDDESMRATAALSGPRTGPAGSMARAPSPAGLPGVLKARGR